MNRTEIVELIRFLNPEVNAGHLANMTAEELHRCLVHLKAMKLQALNQRGLWEYCEAGR